MDFDIQTTIQDNLRLKKSLQMSKFLYDKLQKQYKELQSLYAQQLQKKKNLKDQYCQLQRKYQQSFTDNVKDNNLLINQIQELKKIIQNKQRELEHIQIKLIPNLDQDMLRVKIIGQMQGPYQQIVDKKDKEIQKLKNKNQQLERKLEMTNLSAKNKQNNLKKQKQQIKSKYDQQNTRLIQQLNMALSRNEVHSIQKSIIKNQKKQIQELKVTLEFMNKNQQSLQQDLKNIKQQRNHLLEKLKFLNQKQALFLSGKYSKTQIQTLKEQKTKLNLQLNRIKAENQKNTKIIQKIQQQKFKTQSELQKQLLTQRNNNFTQKNQLNNEILQLKEEIKRLKNTYISTQTQRDKNIERVQRLQRQLIEKNREIQKIVSQSSRYVQQTDKKQSGIWNNCFGKIDNNQNQNQANFQNQTKKIIKKNNQRENQIEQKKQSNIKIKYDEMKKQNQKLKKKINEANLKIVQLLKEKVNKHESPQRDRTVSNYQKKQNGVFLEYEDCAFKPLIQPTLYTYISTSKR